MYCCGPKFLFFEEGFKLKRHGNNSESCACEDGWASIGFNPYPTECTEGAVVCTGHILTYEVLWLVVLVGVLALFAVRTMVCSREGWKKTSLEIFKFLADTFLFIMVLGNIATTFQFDLIQNKLGLFCFDHWMYFASTYDRFSLVKAIKYLRLSAVRIDEDSKSARKVPILLKLTENQRAVLDVSIAYVAICWPCWLAILYPSIGIGAVLQYAPITSVIWQVYGYGTNTLVMREVLHDLKVVEELDNGKIGKRLERAIRIGEAKLEQFKVVGLVVGISQILLSIFYQLLREMNYLMLFLILPSGVSQELKVLLERLRTGKNRASIKHSGTTFNNGHAHSSAGGPKSANSSTIVPIVPVDASS